MILSPPGCSGSHRLTSRTIPSTTNHAPPASLCAVMSAHVRTRTRDACVPSRAAHASASERRPNVSAVAAIDSTTRMSYSGCARPSDSASNHANARSKPAQSTSTSAVAATRGASVFGFESENRAFEDGNRAFEDGKSPSSTSSSTAASSSTADPSPNSDRRAFSHSTRFPLLAAPSGAASRIARVSAMHGLRRDLCTGNTSPSFVVTVTVSAAAASAASAAPSASRREREPVTRAPPPTVVPDRSSPSAWRTPTRTRGGRRPRGGRKTMVGRRRRDTSRPLGGG